MLITTSVLIIAPPRLPDITALPMHTCLCDSLPNTVTGLIISLNITHKYVPSCPDELLLKIAHT